MGRHIHNSPDDRVLIDSSAAAMDHFNHLYFPATGEFPFQKIYVSNGAVLWTTLWWDQLNEDNKRWEVSKMQKFGALRHVAGSHALPCRQYLAGFIDRRAALLKKEYVKIFQVDAPPLAVS